MIPSAEPKRKCVIIIGAGPAGLTAAIGLLRTGNYEVTILESSSQVGGLAKTISLWGQYADLGPHRFFSHNKEVNKFWNSVLAEDQVQIHRQTRIFFSKKLFNYPLQPLNVLKNLGFGESIHCFFSYLLSSFSKQNESTFEGWVTKRFGQRLHKMFFKSYSEKLWGISCDKLSSEFAKQRIKKLSFFEILKDSFLAEKATLHKSLARSFLYPIKGSGYLYEKMASEIRLALGAIILQANVKDIIINNFRIQGVRTRDGKEFFADYVVSTMPLPNLIDGISDTPERVKQAAKKLRFRNTILVYLLIDKINLFPDQWLYINNENIKTGRITNFRNWSKQLYGEQEKTIVSLEYWCFADEPIWKMADEELAEWARLDIEKTGFCERSQILDSRIARISKSYPIHDSEHQMNLTIVKSYLNSFIGLYPIGRAGSFKYNNQDHSILMGLQVVKKIEGMHIDLWDINNNDEYQES